MDRDWGEITTLDVDGDTGQVPGIGKVGGMTLYIMLA